jgi:hypothetical protein
MNCFAVFTQPRPEAVGVGSTRDVRFGFGFSDWVQTVSFPRWGRRHHSGVAVYLRRADVRDVAALSAEKEPNDTPSRSVGYCWATCTEKYSIALPSGSRNLNRRIDPSVVICRSSAHTPSTFATCA